jgi:hypothetical protein
MKSTQLILLLALAVASCGGGAGKTTSVDAADQQSADAAAEVESPEDVVLPTDLAPEDAGLDLSPDLGTDTGPTPQCAPGEGCFLDQCEENAECLSGWCVEHIGEGVCTDVCQEECPPGWSCKLLGGGGPDPTYACVSNMSNLCKPCATNADCKSPGAQEDVCVDYGEEGSFCGGACLSDEECPWGFSCGEAVTVSGIGTLQCVAETGICPCSGKSAKLGLSTPCVNASESGTCTGQRVCTDAGLTECDAAAPSIEECNGVDDDCDGDVDEPTAQGGNLINLCDDGNECTQDICGGEAGCSYTELDSGECKDGDACTVGDHCEAGECVGQLVDCDDGNPCTEDWCNPAGGCAHGNSDEECDDGNACTVADRCSDGLCSGYALNCDCEADADCAAFEDDNLCNGTLLCSKEALPYQCEVDPGTVVECEPLTGEAAKCNAAKCDPASGSCIAVPVADGTLCDDGNPCTVTESCVAGECQGGQAVNCNDGNPCTVDACDPATGCTHGNSSEKCEDGNLCTAGDVCDGGICKAGEAVNCDDGNPCTTDTCNPATGCTHGNSNEGCEDGDLCTVGDQCVNGVRLRRGVDLRRRQRLHHRFVQPGQRLRLQAQRRALRRRQPLHNRRPLPPRGVHLRRDAQLQ